MAAVADHLGLFDGWFGSSATENLSSATKAQRLTDEFGAGGFDYAGNDSADLAVWAQARRRIAVDPPAAVRRQLLALDPQAMILERAAGRPPVRGRFMDALPSARELDTTAYRLIAVSFPLWTFTLVAGAIWAEVSWGRYWNWDPKEVWTFVIWVVYAAYLHARATGGWSGRRAAYLAVAGYLFVLVNFGVVNVFFPGNHSYAGIG